MTEYTKESILQFLREHFIMEIATCLDNKPAASVMLYALNDDFSLYFATHKDSYKSQNLQKNPQISLCIWEHLKALVQMDGKVEVVENEQEKSVAMDKLADAATKDKEFWPPLFRIKGDEYIIFKMSPQWGRLLDLSRSTITQEETPFVEIDFSKN